MKTQSAGTLAKRASGRTRKSREPRSYVALLVALEHVSGAQAVRSFANRIQKYFKDSGSESILETVTIKRMLRGHDGMSEAVLHALHRLAGFDAKKLPLTIWDAATPAEFDRIRGASDKDLLAQIRRLPKGPNGGSLRLERVGDALARISHKGAEGPSV